MLSDAPRSGSPGKFTAEQVTQILAVACEPPENSGRPVDRWTARELADEVVCRQIVPSISRSQVGCYLDQADLQPHRSKYWLNTKEKDPQLFEQQVQTVCQTYLEAPQLYFQANTHTISVDEMPGAQALERVAKTIPMQPGQPVRIEYEYRRHGTLCLIGNWDVVQGQMIAPTIGATRTEEDFAAHIQRTVQTDAEAYLPKHTSWLNQIEIVFGIVGRRVLRRGNFPSLAALEHRLLDFIDYFNRTFAKPFRWTYTGRPVTAETVNRPATWKEVWASRRANAQTLALVG